MIKVAKFGGSSVASAKQFSKVKKIVLSDPSRRIVVISAAGKRNPDDHKLTDLLYLCHAHLTYGVSCDDIFDKICERFIEIRDELSLTYKIEDDLTALKARLNKDMSIDELVSRGEYLTSRLMPSTWAIPFWMRQIVFSWSTMAPLLRPRLQVL